MASTEKFVHLTATSDEIRAGKLCDCEACVRDGQHLPDCNVHDEPKQSCSCARQEQVEGAG